MRTAWALRIFAVVGTVVALAWGYWLGERDGYQLGWWDATDGDDT